MATEEKVQRFDSIPLDKTYFTDEGYLIDHPIVTSVGIFVYHNADGTERRELRLPEEVFATQSLASYKGKPVIITHDAGYVDTDNVQQEHVGTILSEGYQDGNDVRAEIVIHDMETVKNIGMRELSCGYNLRLEETPGVWNGQPYDAIQRDIEINHLALVDKARAGEQARLNIDSKSKEHMKGEKLNMAKTKRKDGDLTPEAVENAVEAFKKRRDARIAAAKDGGSDDPETAPAQDPKQDDCDTPDTVQSVKDRRDRRDAEGDPENLDDAMDVIAKQDEDIDSLLGVIDFLKEAQKQDSDDDQDNGDDDLNDDGDDDDQNKDGDDDPEEDKQADKKDGTNCAKDSSGRADSASDFRELLRVVRVGDRLNMDGLEAMSVKGAKKAVLKKLKPNLRMDGKSNAYVNAAFDMAVEEMKGSRKGTNYQRGQMMHKDSAPARKSTGSAAEARQRMINRMHKEEK